MSDIVYEKEPEYMTDEEQVAELREGFKNIRKISVLEKLQLYEWTTDELEEMHMMYSLFEAAGSLKATNMTEFIRSGEYKERHGEFDEYKISELTEEMKSKLCDFLNLKYTKEKE